MKKPDTDFSWTLLISGDEQKTLVSHSQHQPGVALASDDDYSYNVYNGPLHLHSAYGPANQ